MSKQKYVPTPPFPLLCTHAHNDAIALSLSLSRQDFVEMAELVSELKKRLAKYQ